MMHHQCSIKDCQADVVPWPTMSGKHRCRNHWNALEVGFISPDYRTNQDPALDGNDE
jgi:hypothetical protein